MFDPCTGIGDSVIEKIGFDPRTRKRDDYIDEDYSFIGCLFDQNGTVDGSVMNTHELRIDSSNITLDEFRKRDAGKLTTVKVNGQDALMRKDGAETCFLDIPGPDGTLNFQFGVLDPHSTENPCDRAIAIAGVIQAAVPK